MKTTVANWLKENKDKYDNWKDWVQGCVDELGVTRQSVKKKSIKICKMKTFNKPDVAVITKPKAMNRADFLSKYDLNTKTREAIRRGIKTIHEQENSEEDELLEDSEFRLDRCGDASVSAFRRIANEPEFRDYQFSVGDRIFWTTARQKQWAIESVPRAKEV